MEITFLKSSNLHSSNLNSSDESTQAISDYQDFIHQNGGAFLQDLLWGEFQTSLHPILAPVRILVYEQGKIIGASQVLFSKLGQAQTGHIPYGPVVAEKEKLNEVTNFIAAELKKVYPKLLFLRLEPTIEGLVENKRISKSRDIHPHQTLVLNLQQTPDQILAQMHPKTRYNIKVAVKHGVQVRVESALGQGLATNLFKETAYRAGFKSFDPTYYQKILSYFSNPDLSVHAKLYAAWHEGDLLAANLLIFYDNKTVIYLHGGSASLKRNTMAPYLLHWQAIQDAQTAGYQLYDFWGVETDPKHDWFGFSRFKLGFGGEIKKYSGTFDYVYNAAWYNVYKGLRKLNRIIRK